MTPVVLEQEESSMKDMNKQIAIFNNYFNFKVEVPAEMKVVPVFDEGEVGTEYGALSILYREQREYCSLSLKEDKEVSVMFEEVSEPENLLKQILAVLPPVGSVEEAKSFIEDEAFWESFDI